MNRKVKYIADNVRIHPLGAQILGEYHELLERELGMSMPWTRTVEHAFYDAKQAILSRLEEESGEQAFHREVKT